MATESDRFLLWPPEDAKDPSMWFRAPSEVGVSMPDRVRDASAPGTEGEDM